MSVVACIIKHMGPKSPIRAYKADMSGDVDELVAGGMDKDAAWLQVIDEKLANLRGEKQRIEQVVADAYANTAAGKRAPKPAPTPAQAPAADAAPAGEVAAVEPVAEKPAKQPAAKIGDFGEKLEGARKDYATTLKDAEDVDVSAEPFSKSWPEPDYQKLLDGGADPFVVAFIHAARDEVPTKPQKSWKLKGWVDSVQTLRGAARGLLAGSISREQLDSKLTLRAFDNVRRNVGSRAELYQLVGHEKSLKGITFAEHQYTLYKGQSNVRKWVVEQKAKATMFSNWPRELAVADTKEEMLEQFRARFAEPNATGKNAPAKGKFSVYTKRKQEGVFIGKKIGREYIDLKKLPDIASARKFLDENTAELETLLEKYKETPFERNPENQPRVGDDHRNGAPVTPKIFEDTFGFRGVQFGNYVEQARRQSDLNQGFDSLMDLAAVLGVPPRALSLNGRLGLAFGARGKGGTNAPAAHYEPGNVVINLTKNAGPGSLAHEWWHAVDNYFGKNDGGAAYGTGGTLTDKTRAAMRLAFNEVKSATQQGTLRRRAMELDKRKSKSKPYWDTPIELSARSFESYVIAKLKDQGAANDYLANVVSKEFWDAQEALRAGFLAEGKPAETYPYPTPDEVPAVRNAFDNFFRVVETRADDAGNVALFSRAPGAQTDTGENDDAGRGGGRIRQGGGEPGAFGGDGGGVDPGRTAAGARRDARVGGRPVGIDGRQDRGMEADGSVLQREANLSRAPGGRAGVPIADAEAVADAIRAAYPTGPQIVVLDDVRKAPEALLDQIRAVQAANTVEGAYYKGKIYLFPQNVADIARLMFVGAHHEIRHAGLDALFGKRKGALLLGIAMSNPKVAAAARAKIADGVADSMVAATEEALADMPLEDMAKLNGWSKIVAAVRQWLRGMADKLRRNHPKLAAMIEPDQWTDNDVAALIRRAEDISRGGTVPARPGGAVFSLDAEGRADQTQTPAFRRWFGSSKVVDAQGKPLVVYHGTMASFDAFRIGWDVQGEGEQALGIFFGTEDQAQAVAGDVPPGATMQGFDKARVIPAYLKMENPLRVKLDAKFWFSATRVTAAIESAGVDVSSLRRRIAAHEKNAPVFTRQYADAQPFDVQNDTVAEVIRPWLVERGFDGIIYPNTTDGAEDGRPSYIVFRPEQIKSSTGNSGAFDPDTADIRFSRAGTAKTTAQRQVTQAVRNTVADMLGNAGAKVSWWDKTLGTQYAKAQKFPAFKRVFEQVQQYQEDVSSLANEAADGAPNILPKLETWKDLKRAGLSDADAQAVAGPVFTGTLTDEKVYSDGELRSKFNLSDKQIGLYREFMASVNTSLDQVVAADVVRLLGDKNPALQELAVTDRAALQAGVDEFLSDQIEQAADDPENQQSLIDLREQVREKYARIADLKAKGYAPLMRFGKYAVNVADPETGESLFFGLYESRADSNRMARELGEDPAFKGKTLTQGVLSAEQYKLFQGVPMESLEMFANAIGADQSQVFQEYLKLAKNNRSALKRLIKRKGTAGFSEDVPRVLAAFATSNARLASGAMNWTKANEAAQDIRDGDVKDEAIKLIDEVQNPGERANLARGLMFMNFIGGSIASAVVNVTQPLTMTLPYLTQWGGMGKASARLLAATKMAASGKIDDLALKVALKRAEADGIVSPQEIHYLTSQAMGSWGNNQYLKKAAFIWGAPFSLAEQFNRRVTFIAAYNTAKAEGLSDPFSFAENAVTETQGLYNKGNAPNITRSAIGASAFTFKQFSVHYLEWMGRMWKAGPEGKKAVGIALALLILAAGTDGLPFADDLDDLIDTLAQAMGYDLNSKRARREFVANTLGLGDASADMAARGLSAIAGFPMDVSLRMSMGNLIPGSGVLLRSNTDKSSDLLEVAGPLGGLTKQYLTAGEALLRGDVGEAVQAAVPVAIQNAIKGTSMWATGEARDTRGRKVMEATGLDAAVKGIGFNPASIARESQKMGMIRRSEQLAKNVEGEIVGAWARAIVDKDQDAIAEARAKLADWNESNPESRIRITMQQLIQRAKKLRETRAQRFITSTSPERRRAVAEELQ